MNLLARLMSHGFSLAVVLLLAIGFIYRGELFPEWKLPDFLALHSKDKTVEEQAAGTIEPAPIQDDRLEAGMTAHGQGASATKEDNAGTGTVHPEMPPVDEEVTAPGAEAMAEAASDVAETDEALEAPGTVAAPAPVVEEPGAGSTPAATETAEEPVTYDLQESSESTTVMTGTGGAAELPDESQVEATEAAAADASAGVESAQHGLDTGMTSGPADGVMTSAVQGAAGAGSAPVATAPEVAGEAPVSAGEAEAAPDSTGAGEEITPSDNEEAFEEAGESDSMMQFPAPRSGMPAVEAPSSYQLLASAREAFWLRDYQGAEDHYLQLIRNDPDNPDGYGELANMYFSQGKWEAAASAYYEAGTRLVKSGLLDQARELVEVIRGLDGSQADTLEQEIQAAQGGVE